MFHQKYLNSQLKSNFILKQVVIVLYSIKTPFDADLGITTEASWGPVCAPAIIDPAAIAPWNLYASTIRATQLTVTK